MLTEPTIDKLHALRLGAMAAAWTAQREDPKMNEIDFDGRFVKRSCESTTPASRTSTSRRSASSIARSYANSPRARGSALTRT